MYIAMYIHICIKQVLYLQGSLDYYGMDSIPFLLLQQQPANISQCGPAVSSSLLSFHSYPCLTEPDVLNPYWTHEHGGMSSH